MKEYLTFPSHPEYGRDGCRFGGEAPPRPPQYVPEQARSAPHWAQHGRGGVGRGGEGAGVLTPRGTKAARVEVGGVDVRRDIDGLEKREMNRFLT